MRESVEELRIVFEYIRGIAHDAKIQRVRCEKFERKMGANMIIQPHWADEMVANVYMQGGM